MEEVTLAKVFSVKSNQNDLLYYSKLCAISISSDQISLSDIFFSQISLCFAITSKDLKTHSVILDHF